MMEAQMRCRGVGWFGWHMGLLWAALWAWPAAGLAGPKKPLRFAVVGDIMAHHAQLQSAYDAGCKCHRFRHVFEEVRPLLSAADIALGNLETTLPGAKAGYTRPGTMVFGAPDALADALRWAGLDLLITANNHICDKGFAGLARTLQTLDRHKLMHFGAYRSARAYRQRRFLMLKRRGWRVALLSYTSHVAGCRGKQERVNLLYWPWVRRDIKLARREKPDAIIVHYHSGAEYQRRPSKSQRGAAMTALRAGADVVIGGHPHVIQPFVLRPSRDRYGVTKPRLAVYSMGNFVSNIYRNPYAMGGMVLYFQLHKQRSKGALQTRLRGVQYKTTWVYKRKRKGATSFHVLPIEKYKRGKGKFKLPPRAYRKMLRFDKSTRAQLRRSMRLARRYGR